MAIRKFFSRLACRRVARTRLKLLAVIWQKANRGSQPTPLKLALARPRANEQRRRLRSTLQTHVLNCHGAWTPGFALWHVPSPVANPYDTIMCLQRSSLKYGIRVTLQYTY